MAAININVNDSTGLASVSIDWNDWESFVVMDGDNSPVNLTIAQGGGATYQQKESQFMQFIVTANTNTLQPVNPGLTLILAGSDCNYQCTITFQGDGVTTPLVLTGSFNTVPSSIPATGASPLLFSQVHMTGSFTLSN